MIRVNLIEASKKSTKRSSRREGRQGGSGFDMWILVWVGVVLGFAGYGYLWFSDLEATSDALNAEIQALTTQRDELQSVIDQDQVYEERRAALEARVDAIERLQRNQVSPIISLDMISQAVENTQYVWLSQLQQSDTRFTLGGTGSSITAIANFITSLEETGYFRNIDILNVQANGTNFEFQLNSDFISPSLPSAGD